MRRGGGPGIAFHAGTARRFATWASTGPGLMGLSLEVVNGAAPTLAPVPGTWGFHAPPAPDLDLPVDAGEAVVAERIVIGADRDGATAMEAVADLVATLAGARKWTGAPMTGWESWYHYGFAVTPESLLANARLLRERFGGRPGFDLVQLDDGWQRAYGDWTPREGWPSDLSDLTAELRGLGCRPGLWLAPFMVWPGTPGMGQRPHLLVADPATGQPTFDPLMGRHAVDASHPDALGWLEELGRQVRRWGFEMVKLDFLYFAALEGRRHDPASTGTEALRRGLAAFVRGLGNEIYVLGCGMPMLPGVGLCHGNRIGGDLSAPATWPPGLPQPFDPEQGFLGVRPQARNVAARWWTHGRLFANDPDVVMAAGPDDGPPFSVEEARTLAVLAAMCGGPYLMADDLAALSPAKRAVLEDARLLDLAWGHGFRPADLTDEPDDLALDDAHFYSQPGHVPSVWVAERDRHSVVALFNWTDEPAVRSVTVDGPVQELWTGERFDGPDVTLDVPPHGVRVLLSGGFR